MEDGGGWRRGGGRTEDDEGSLLLKVERNIVKTGGGGENSYQGSQAWFISEPRLGGGITGFQLSCGCDVHRSVTPGVSLGLSRFAGRVWFGELSGTNAIVIKMRVKSSRRYNTANIDTVTSP